MAESNSGEGAKRFRSPPYPAIPLSKAIERVKELHGKALHHSVSIKVVADAWDYGIKSSGLWAAAAALLQFGLLSDEGTGSSRKFTLTESAIRIIRDPNPESEKRRELIKQAALSPKVFKELWAAFGPTVTTLSDVVLKSHLTVDRQDSGLASYSDNAADEVIRVFKESIAFAGLSDSDSLPAASEEKEAEAGAAGASQTGEVSKVVSDKPPKPGVTPIVPPLPPVGKVKIMDGERVVFTEESNPQSYLKLIASGDVDETMLEALEDYVKRQKKRLGLETKETAN